MDTSTANQINCVEANIEGIFHNKEFKDGNVKYREKNLNKCWNIDKEEKYKYPVDRIHRGRKEREGINTWIHNKA